MIEGKRHWFWLLLALVLLAAAVQVGREATEAPAAPAVEAPRANDTLDAVVALGVPNARMPQPGLVTAGQPSPEQLEGLKELGYSSFISLRLASENGAGWEEALAAREGLSFSRLPVSGADGLTRDNVEELARLLSTAGDEPTVLYCGSSNRVGALLALKAHWLDGSSPSEALELGRAAGLTRLEPAVRALLEAPEG